MTTLKVFVASKENETKGHNQLKYNAEVNISLREVKM